MKLKLPFSIAALLLISGAAGATDFSELYSGPLPAFTPELQAPADKHAVTYLLRGLVTVHPAKTVLNTEDGRVFILEISEEQAAEFDNRTVEIWGKAEASDDVDTLKVSSIQEYTPDPAAVPPPPHKSKFKPAEFLGDTDGALSVSNMRWLTPDAVSHDFSWVNASIRPEMIKDVYFVTKVQPPGIAGHSLLFYEFEDGGFMDASGRKSKGFFLSVEAYAREGQSYSLIAGFKKTYGIIWLLTNFEDYVMDSAAFSGDWMNFYPVLADKAGKEKMVRDTVAMATLNRDGEWYHSTRNNCTNNLVMMINHGQPKKKQVKMWAIPNFWYNFYATTPPMVPNYLARKGVLGPKAYTIEKENFRQYIPLPAQPAAAVPAPVLRSGSVTGDVSVLALPYFLGGRRVWVYLPPGYASAPARRYPVLYMHDGQNLFDASASYSGEWRVDETCEELILSGRIPPLIVVGIENGGAARMDEYTPWADKAYGGGKADGYLAALEKILKPEIDRRYRTRPGPGDTFMAGSSLGGLLSAYAGYTSPKVWGGVIAMSPSYWWAEQRFAAWAAPRAKPGLRFFYQDMGTREGGADPGVTDYIGTLRKVEAAALAQGFKEGADLFSFEAPGHAHSEASWAERFPFVLKLLLDRP